MSRSAGRIAAFTKAAGVAVVCAVGLYGCVCHAQTGATDEKPAQPTTYSGCVTKAPGADGTLVLNTPTTCAALKGKVSADDLAGHEIELKGVLTPATKSVAASIAVSTVLKVGKSCSDVCSLQPPRTRGLHPPGNTGHEIPGSEGGTPGVTQQPK